MKYKPSRDIPLAAIETRSLSPSVIAEWAKEHRYNLKKGIKYQENVTANAVTVWMLRNPDIVKKMEEDQKTRELDKVVMTSGLFENGSFKEIASIQNFIRELTNRGAKADTIRGWIQHLKRICQGEVRKGEEIAEWGMKHPDKLSIEDAKAFIYEVKKRGYRSREWRLVLRSFLSSKGIVVRSNDISGELEEDAGKFADLFVSREKVYQILEVLKGLNKIAYAASFFAYKTASRLTAVLNAEWQYMNTAEQTLTVFEKSERGKAKKRVPKMIPSDLMQTINEYCPKEGRLFPIDNQELNNLCRTAFKAIIPELEPRIVRPFHFWRHMFAQHMLRASGWNLSLTARLGNWSVEALEKYYGKADEQTVRKFAVDTLPKI